MKGIKNIIHSYPFRLFLFVELIFIFFRLLFVSVLLIKGKNLQIDEIPSVFIYANRLDFSAVTYIISIPVLLWIINLYIKNKLLSKINYLLNVFLLPLTGIIGLLNIFTFYAWGTIINARAVSFFLYPKEIVASMSTIQILSALLLIIITSISIVHLYKRKVHPVFANQISTSKHLTLIWLAIFPITLRGGLQQIPINESVCMFSKNENTNLASINSFWYLINSIYKAQNINNKAYQFYSDQEANNYYKALYQSASNCELNITNTDKPNIITIVFESWTADIIESLGGEKGVTPFFNSLEKEGIMFDQIYAAGKRTDLMFPSLFSGFPAMPDISIIKYSDKTANLPFITHSIKQLGYQTSFNYGGELGFANMKSYLTQAKFDIIRGKESFPSEQWTSKWGVYDGVMFNDAATTISQLTPPFYSVVLTQSTHEPFAIPIAPKFEGSSESVKFKNAAYYTDCSLKAFIEKIKKEKWYENTLLILVADHGHILPRNRDYSDPAAFKIPLLITGPALKKEYRNFRYSVIGNQQDYAATIKSILNLPIELPFSNSLLKCKRTNFCYMNYDDGFIWKDDRSTFKLNYSNRKATLSNPSIDSLSLKNGCSFLQTAYKYFVGL